MALINCPECGKENVSDSAENCPNCGYGIKKHYEKIKDEERKKEEEQKRIEQLIESIKMPKKPELSDCFTPRAIAYLLFIFFICIILPTTAEKSELTTFIIYDVIFLGVFFILPLYGFYSNYKDEVKEYEFAQNDFETYREKKLKEKLRQEKIANFDAIIAKYKPKCPHCGSINIERIGTLDRAVSVGTLGLASGKIGKQYKCKACKHLW